MVKTIRLAAVLAALACLGSCDLINGIFPDRLMIYEAYADLSGYIDPDHAWEYNFQIIRSSRNGTEYLVLAYDGGPIDADYVVILNADLKVLGHYSLDRLDDMDPGHPFDSCGAMVDASGRIVVGNRRFEVLPLRVKYLDTPPIAPHQPGLAVPDAPDPNLADIRGDALSLKFERYSASWAFSAPMSMQLSGSPWHEVLGAWLTATDVLLVVRHDPIPFAAHVLKMNDMMFATGGLTPPLITGPGGYANTIDPFTDIEWRTLGYTNEGFAAFRWTSNQYYRFDPSGLELGTPLDVPDDKDRPHNQRHVYGRQSGWYIFDMNRLTLERREWWWK